MLRLIDRLGARTIERASAYLGLGVLAYAAVKGALVERGRGLRMVVRTIAMQVYFTAVEPLFIFVFTGVIFGFVVIVISDRLLPEYGLGHHIPNLVCTALVREVGPLVIAMVLIGRSGTAIATELGYMKVNREIEALSAMGVNLDYFIVLPRLVGVCAATTMLTVVFAASGLVGGFVLGELLDLISVTLLFRELVAAVTLEAIAIAFLKATFFGATIALSNCYHGLRVEGSFTQIPKANVQGVVQSLLVCFVVNAVVSVYSFLVM